MRRGRRGEFPSIGTWGSDPMDIVIVGAGLVGTTLAERLSRDGNDVSLVDKNPAAVQMLAYFREVMPLLLPLVNEKRS